MSSDWFNSQHAVEQMKIADIMTDEKAVSFDAVSMFTNISTGEAITIVKAKLQKLRFVKDTIDIILEVIKFTCLTATEISFNERLYKQIKDLRMGLPNSPILADIVMNNLLDSGLHEIRRRHGYHHHQRKLHENTSLSEQRKPQLEIRTRRTTRE